jgi:hypothetical protein
VAPTPESVELGAGDVLGHVAPGLHWEEPVILSVQHQCGHTEAREQGAYFLRFIRIEQVLEHFGGSCSTEPQTGLDEVATSRLRKDSGVVQFKQLLILPRSDQSQRVCPEVAIELTRKI